MRNKVLAFALGILLVTASSFAQDVKIDSTGNVTTGASNSNANLEVIGSSGEDGIVGSASGAEASGVYGINTTSNNYGTLGHGSYGVYGNSSSGYAGYFDGNAWVSGDLNVVGNISGNITETDPGVNALGKAVLSCTNGQVAKYSGGTWDCGDDIDTDTDTIRSEAEVETFITNGPIDLDAGSTIGGVGIADVNHTHPGGGAYAGTAVVATGGGDYTNPVTALGSLAAWCGTPSATNRCLLKIMPGVYNVGSSSVQMQSYVDIEGSGENVTKITGAVDNPNWFVLTLGLVYGADNAEIRSLTIENTSAGNQTVAMINNSVSPKVTNVTLNSTGGVTTYGVYSNTSNTVMNNVTIGAQGANGIALYNENACSLEVTASRLTGALNSISSSPGANTLVASTKLDGAVSAPAGVVSCFASYDASYGAVSCP